MLFGMILADSAHVDLILEKTFDSHIYGEGKTEQESRVTPKLLIKQVKEINCLPSWIICVYC